MKPENNETETLTAVGSSDLLDVCFSRAVQLIWSDPKERTCGEIKQILMEEFGVKTVADMLHLIDPELVKKL